MRQFKPIDFGLWTIEVFRVTWIPVDLGGIIADSG